MKLHNVLLKLFFFNVHAAKVMGWLQNVSGVFDALARGIRNNFALINWVDVKILMMKHGCESTLGVLATLFT